MKSAAIASRSGLAPQVTAYWLMSARIASHGGVLDRLGRREVRKALRQVDGAVLVRQPRHLADDRLGEPRGFLGRARPRHLWCVRAAGGLFFLTGAFAAVLRPRSSRLGRFRHGRGHLGIGPLRGAQVRVERR